MALRSTIKNNNLFYGDEHEVVTNANARLLLSKGSAPQHCAGRQRLEHQR